MKISKFLLIIVMLSILTGCAPALKSNDHQQHKLSPLEKEFITTDYQLIYRIKEFPEPVVNIIKQKIPRIVNSGEQFNLTDVTDPTLSNTQLIWGGIAKESTFVFYIRGGFAPELKLLIIKLDEQQITSSEEIIIHQNWGNSLVGLKRDIQSEETINTKK